MDRARSTRAAGAQPGGQPAPPRPLPAPGRNRGRPRRGRAAGDIDWHRIAAIYRELGRISPSPVVELTARSLSRWPMGRRRARVDRRARLARAVPPLPLDPGRSSATPGPVRRRPAAAERARSPTTNAASKPSSSDAGGGRLTVGVRTMVEPLRRVLVAPLGRGFPLCRRDYGLQSEPDPLACRRARGPAGCFETPGRGGLTQGRSTRTRTPSTSSIPHSSPATGPCSCGRASCAPR